MKRSKNERINSCNCDFDDLRKYTRKKHKIPNVNAEIARNKVCQLLIKLKFLSTRVTTIAVKTIESTGALKSHIPLSSLFETRLIRLHTDFIIQFRYNSVYIIARRIFPLKLDKKTEIWPFFARPFFLAVAKNR